MPNFLVTNISQLLSAIVSARNGDTIYINGGVYKLPSALHLTSVNSGVTYQAVGTTPVVFSGGLEVAGWTNNSGVYQADCLITATRGNRTVYSKAIGETRYTRSQRLDFDASAYATLETDGTQGINADADEADIKAASLPTWAKLRISANAGLPEITDWHELFYNVAGNSWQLSVAPLQISAYVYNNGIHEFTYNNSLVANMQYDMLTTLTGGGSWDAPYHNAYFCNVSSLLNSAKKGAAFISIERQKISYVPRLNEDITTSVIIMPILEQLLVIDGAINIIFNGISFAFTKWDNPVDYNEVQANYYKSGFTGNWLGMSDGSGFDPWNIVQTGDASQGGVSLPYNTVFNDQTEACFLYQGAYQIYGITGADPSSPLEVPPAAVDIINGSSNIVFNNCEVAYCGGRGISIGVGCSVNTIRNSHIHDTSANGVSIGDIVTRWGGNCHDNEVLNCEVDSCAIEYFGGVGIFVGVTNNTKILHNYIHSIPYTGISIGWGWYHWIANINWNNSANDHSVFNRVDDSITDMRNNEIAYNVVANINWNGADGGSIYSLGCCGSFTDSTKPNNGITTIHDNYIYSDPVYYTSIGRGTDSSLPIYVDEGSFGIHIYNNVAQKPNVSWGGQPQKVLGDTNYAQQVGSGFLLAQAGTVLQAWNGPYTAYPNVSAWPSAAQTIMTNAGTYAFDSSNPTVPDDISAPDVPTTTTYYKPNFKLHSGSTYYQITP